MSSRSVRLGPFELFAPIARGGMGEVWRGRHIRQGVPVAVKVMTAKATRREDYLLDFRNEVRSVARLDHPGIVIVFDHGEVDEEAQKATRGRLVAGSPFLAMELASGGLRDLMRRQRVFSWSVLRTILRAVLDALAHAHARGVIHRDLKPHNVLMFKSGNLKLSDFGIAHAAGNETLHRVIGTPQYMSPEQLMRHWRDYGPWTDLYALGVMAYQLCSGKLPFRGSGPTLQRAHLYEQPPPLRPKAPVPDGFGDWVFRLMDKNARGRFLRAADAAWALQSLGDPPEGDEIPEDELAKSISVSQEFATFSFSTGSVEVEAPPLKVIPDIVPSEQRQFGRPPIPITWRMRHMPAPAPQLLDAGLGLFALRDFQLVGRETERDTLWRALSQVHGAGAARMCLVHGVSGIGKSRLVEWIVDRAHEVGAASVLTCQHDPNDDPGEAIRHMVDKYLDTERLDKASLRTRLRALLTGWSEASIEALVELLSPTPEDLETSVRFQHPKERFAIIEELLRWMCHERPVILVLEDVHWGRESLGLAEHLLKAQAVRPLAVLLLVTARDDLVAENPGSAEHLQRLQASSLTRRVPLSPLNQVERAQLVRELLGLEDTLAAQVEERTAGNPAFTIQLVGDWVQRGVLQVGPDGFTLEEGEEALLPQDLRGVAAARVEQILEDLPERARRYLELAAALGRDVDDEEWQVACDCEINEDWTMDGSFVSFSPEGARIRARMVDRLFAQHLAEETDYGWSFVQGAFRESLVMSAQRAGRWQEHHMSCAAILRHREDVEVSAERIGRHLMEAGALEAAVDLLMTGVKTLRKTSSYRDALSLIGTCEETLKIIDPGEADPRWGQIMVERVAIQRLQGDQSEAMRWANRAVLVAQRHQWDEVLPMALVEKATVAVNRRELNLAEKLLEEALALTDDANLRARCLQNLATVQHGRGDIDRGNELLSEARQLFADVGDDFGQAECWRAMAPFEDAKRGMSLLERASEVYKRMGMRSGIAYCVNASADIQRRSGDLRAAELGFNQAIKLFDAIGGRDGNGVYPRMNLGLIYLQRGELEDAKDVVEEARAALARTKRAPLLASSNIILMATAGAQSDWQTWDRCYRAAKTLLRRTRFQDRDLAWAAMLAGRHAYANRDLARAVDAWDIARSQYEGLGDDEALREVSALLDKLDSDATDMF